MTDMRGFWIKKGYVCGESEYECSACLETEWRTSIGRFKFCPFCGIRMAGVINASQQPVE